MYTAGDVESYKKTQTSQIYHQQTKQRRSLLILIKIFIPKAKKTHSLLYVIPSPPCDS